VPKKHVFIAAAAFGAAASAALAGAPVSLSLSSGANPTADGRVAVIVLLADPPAARYEGGIADLPATAPSRTGLQKITLAPEALASYENYLTTRQDQFLAAARSQAPTLAAGSRYRIVLNGLALLAPPADLPRLARLPGVARIVPVRRYWPVLDASNPVMKAPAFWALLGGDDRAGEGIKIGILDTGIDFSNPMFSDPSLAPPPGFPKGDTSLANSKVIVAKYFQAIADAGAQNLDRGHKTAEDLVGHGSHVAGVAAGARVALSSPGQRAVTIEGVAPKAWLGDYRIFAPRAETDNIVAAIEDAVSDGMDVINLSFGSPGGYDTSQDPIVEAVENAVAAGVVVTIAAGNDGPNSGSIGSPAAAEDAIAVGATDNAHYGVTDLGVFHTTGGNPAVPAGIASLVGGACEGSCSLPTSPLSGPLGDADLADGSGTGIACTPLPAGSLTGQIALVERGTCTFSVKGSTVRAAGAIGMVIYNSDDPTASNSAEELFNPAFTAPSVPAILLRRSDGLALKAFIDANASPSPTSTGDLAAAPPGTTPFVGTTTAEVLEAFSSRGPTFDDRIKPDLTSVGQGSYAPCQNDSADGENRFPAPDPHLSQATLYDPSGFTFADGTSFSAPRAAGAAALVKQLHPAWTPDLIKAALAETAARPTDSGKVGTELLMSRGSGDIDLAAAGEVRSLALPIHVSFGRLAVDHLPETRTAAITLKNLSAGAATYTASVTATHGDPAVTASLDRADVTLAAGAETTLTLTLSVASGLSAGEIDSEGYVAISDGAATIPGILYIPYWVRTASEVGTPPTIESVNAIVSATNGSDVDIEFTASDPDGDMAGVHIDFFDATGAFVDTTGDQPVTLSGTSVTGTITVNGGAGSACPGCASVRLQIYDSKGNRSNVVPDTFLVPTSAIPASGSDEIVVPLVAHVQGSKFFQSDVRLFNPDPLATRSVAAYFLPQGGDSATALLSTLTLDPRQTLSLPDIVYTKFKQRSGIGSLTLVSADDHFDVTSRAYSPSANGTFGTFVPGSSASLALGEGLATANGLMRTVSFHTNAGLTETDGAPATVEIDLSDASGAPLGQTTQTVGPHQNLQFDLFDTIMPGASAVSNARATFRVVAGSGRVLPYATIVDDSTGDGVFEPAVSPALSTQDIIIPQASHAQGANGTFFVTDLHITNAGQTPVSLSLSLIPRVLTGSPRGVDPFPLAPGATFEALDVLSSVFGLADPSAAGIVVHPVSAASLVVTTRTYVPAFGGTEGFFIGGVAAASALRAGAPPEVALHLDANAATRSNFGFAEVLGAPVTVQVTARDASGQVIGVPAVYLLGANASFQTSLTDIVGGSADGVLLEFEVLSGSGGILPYATAIDNLSGDAIYVPAVPDSY
jgi:minor extracellular serine protease Vpr